MKLQINRDHLIIKGSKGSRIYRIDAPFHDGDGQPSSPVQYSLNGAVIDPRTALAAALRGQVVHSYDALTDRSVPWFWTLGLSIYPEGVAGMFVPADSASGGDTAGGYRRVEVEGLGDVHITTKEAHELARAVEEDK